MNGSKRNYMIYGTMLAVFGLLMWWVVRMGEAYDTSDVVAVRHADSSVDLLRETLASNLTHPVPLLLLQIIAILVAVRIFSYLFKYLGQPGVIGEIVAGIVLGPSVLGHFFPGAFEFLVRAVVARAAERDQPDRPGTVHVRDRYGARSGRRAP